MTHVANTVEKERQKAEKQAKFEAKKAKLAAAKKAAGPPKPKKEKAAPEPIPEYVEKTPKGEKKSAIPWPPVAA